MRLGSTTVDASKALELKAIGNSYSEIAKIFDTTPQNVHKILLNRYPDINIEEFCVYHKRPDAWFDLEAYRLITKIDDEHRSKMLERRGVTDIAILTDKARLVRGQSTSINEVVPTQVINVIQARLEISSSSNLTPKDQVIDITPDKQNA
jgi:hypothetical protein